MTVKTKSLIHIAILISVLSLSLVQTNGFLLSRHPAPRWNMARDSWFRADPFAHIAQMKPFFGFHPIPTKVVTESWSPKTQVKYNENNVEIFFQLNDVSPSTIDLTLNEKDRELTVSGPYPGQVTSQQPKIFFDFFTMSLIQKQPPSQPVWTKKFELTERFDLTQPIHARFENGILKLQIQVYAQLPEPKISHIPIEVIPSSLEPQLLPPPSLDSPPSSALPDSDISHQQIETNSSLLLIEESED